MVSGVSSHVIAQGLEVLRLQNKHCPLVAVCMENTGILWSKKGAIFAHIKKHPLHTIPDLL